MRLATSEHLIHDQGLVAHHSLKALRARGLRPAVGFMDPWDVLKDPHLTAREKREILCSWASDASAVRDEPALRWLLGTPEPVPLDEVRAALARLERQTGAAGETRADQALRNGGPARREDGSGPLRHRLG